MSLIFDMRDKGSIGLGEAVAALRAGGLVAMPTETVYGLAADATNALAVAGIFAAKGRPRFNPLISHVATVEDADRLAMLPAPARRLVERFWPGPLTIVAPIRARNGIADLVIAGLDTIAVRVPAHPIANALLAAFGRPLAAPSANRSGHVSATTARHVLADLGESVAVILDAGAAEGGLESTIVAWDGETPMLLRAGGIPSVEIEEVLGRPLAIREADQTAPAAPGMLVSHYAPAAVLRLNIEDVRPGESLLAFGPVSPPGVSNAVVVRNLSSSANLREAAANLFSALRDLDGRAETIAVAPIPENGLGEAINDRLRRAAAPRR